MKLTIFMMFILMIGLVSAADFTPQGDINLRDVYNIENVLGYDGVNATFDANVTAAYFVGDGQYLTGLNETEVNSSEYWDDMNTINSTQMENSNGELNIKVSWFTTLWNTIFDTKDTDDITEGSTNLYDNQSWNETHADTLYYDIDNSNSYYNSTTLNNVSQLSNDLSYYNSTTLNNVSQLSNDNNYWNDTYATFNKSYADTLYAGIEWDYNQTIPANTYTDAVNDTQATWVDTLFVRFTELVGLVGNWTLDKPSYYIKTDVDTNITSANTSVVNWADSKFVVNSGGDSLSGQYDFNGGWTSSGLSIINGDIYAQTGYFYNITGLDVTTLKINGSLLPMAGYDNTFDVGSSSLRWKDLYLGGEVYSNGTGDSYFLGNVGIGTMNPYSLLHLKSDTAIHQMTIGDQGISDKTAYIYNADAYGLILSAGRDGAGTFVNTGLAAANIAILTGAGDSSITFATTDTNNTNPPVRMTIDKSGDVGIGTTSPDELLHINSSTALGAALKIESTATDGSPFVDLTNDARSWFILNNGDIDDKFSIYDATESEHRLVIDSTGKVGIGTDSPGYKLHINTFTGDQVLKLEANNPKLTMVDTSSSAYTNTIWNHNGDLKFLNNANTVSMLIEQGGSVGIGTTSPDFKLQVNGTIAPEVTSLWDIGSSLLRFAKGWFVDLDVSGNATIADLNVTGDFSAKRAYAMVSSNESQIATVANTAYVMNFSHLEDEYLMNLEGAENITFEDDGDYIMAISTIIITDTNNKHFNVWPQIYNGTDWNNVVRSNTRLEIQNSGTEAAIPVTFILDIEAGEKMRLMYSSDDAGSMTVWTAGSGAGADAIPETPSTIMTIFKHSEITL